MNALKNHAAVGLATLGMGGEAAPVVVNPVIAGAAVATAVVGYEAVAPQDAEAFVWTPGNLNSCPRTPGGVHSKKQALHDFESRAFQHDLARAGWSSSDINAFESALRKKGTGIIHKGKVPQNTNLGTMFSCGDSVETNVTSTIPNLNAYKVDVTRTFKKGGRKVVRHLQAMDAEICGNLTAITVDKKGKKTPTRTSKLGIVEVAKSAEDANKNQLVAFPTGVFQVKVEDCKVKGQRQPDKIVPIDRPTGTVVARCDIGSYVTVEELKEKVHPEDWIHITSDRQTKRIGNDGAAFGYKDQENRGTPNSVDDCADIPGIQTAPPAGHHQEGFNCPPNITPVPGFNANAAPVCRTTDGTGGGEEGALNNTGDTAVTFDVVTNGNGEKITLQPHTSQTIFRVGAEDAPEHITISVAGQVLADRTDTINCVPPEQPDLHIVSNNQEGINAGNSRLECVDGHTNAVVAGGNTNPIADGATVALTATHGQFGPVRDMGLAPTGIDERFCATLTEQAGAFYTDEQITAKITNIKTLLNKMITSQPFPVTDPNG